MTRELGTYSGPGARQWLLSFACSILLAMDAFIGRVSLIPNTSEAFYTRLPLPRFCHALGVVLDALVLVACLAWIVYPHWSKFLRPLLVPVCVLGIAVFWVEGVFAVQHGSGPTFFLRELPMRPLANFGIVGSQVYLTYLVFELPPTRTLLFWGRTLLAAGTLGMQLLLWDGVARAFSHPA